MEAQMKFGINSYWGQEWSADCLKYVEKVAKLGFDVTEIGRSAKTTGLRFPPASARRHMPAPGQAKNVAMLGSLDHVTRQLIVHTSPTKRSSDFVAHLGQLDRLLWSEARPADDNGPIHTSKLCLATLPPEGTGLPLTGCPSMRPN
jgi:hypothetical protein